MKIDWNTEILDDKDEPIRPPKRVNQQTGEVLEWGDVMTLGMLARQALNGMYEDEKSLGGDEKIKRMDLSFRIRDEMKAVIEEGKTGVESDWKVEDLTTVKTLCNKQIQMPLVYYRVAKILDGAANKTVPTAAEPSSPDRPGKRGKP